MGMEIRQGVTAEQILRAMRKDARAMRGKAQVTYYAFAMSGIHLLSAVFTAIVWQDRLGAGAWISCVLGFAVIAILGVLLVQRGKRGLIYICFFGGLIGLLTGVFGAFAGAQAQRAVSAYTIVNLVLDAVKGAASVYLFESKPAKRFFRGMQAAMGERTYRQ